MEPELCDHTLATTGGFFWRCDRLEHDDNEHYMVTVDPDRPKPANRELESALEDFFFKRIRLVGGHATKMVSMQAGTPDRLVLMPGGHLFLVELKQNDGVVSPIQHVWHRRAQGMGCEVHVIYGREGVKSWIRTMVSAIAPDSTDASDGD